MEQKEMIDLLRQVASGTMDVEQAALKLKKSLLKILVLPRLTITEPCARVWQK